MKNNIGIEFRLKRPTLVFLIATGFLLAPFANLALPLFFGGHKSWYNPAIWYVLFMKLPGLEQGLLFSTSIAGILLFLQRKSSWFGAVIILLSVSIYNIGFSGREPNANILSSFNLFINASILIVFYFFRFPYLDQRDHILGGYAKRYRVSIESLINGQFPALIKNISDTGCFFEFTGAPPTLTPDQPLELSFLKPMVAKLTGTVGHIGAGVGIKFKDLSPEQKNFVQQLKALGSQI